MCFIFIVVTCMLHSCLSFRNSPTENKLISLDNESSMNLLEFSNDEISHKANETPSASVELHQLAMMEDRMYA